MADTNTPLNIRFLKGTQANLDAIKNDSTKTFTPGAFYLTEDSERLYYAKDENNIAYLNKYITTVDYVSTSSTGYQQGSSTLPSTANIGDFYYIKSGNILCFYNGGTGENDGDTISKWTQVNVDTQDTDTSVKSLDITNGSPNANKTAIDFSVTLKQADKDDTEISTKKITDTFSISKAAINDLVTQQTVDVTVVGDKTDNTDTKATIKTKLSGSDSEDSFSIEAGLNVGIEVTDSPSSAIGNIKINATDTKYSLDKPAGSTNIKFYEDGDEIEDIEFIAATNTSSATANTDIVVGGVNEDQISIAHKLYSSPAGSGVTDKTVGREDNFTVLKGVTVSNGHVTGFETATITLDIPQDTNTYVTDIDVDGGTITLTRNDGSNDNLVAENKLYYTIDSTKYYNQANLTTPIKTYIENNLSKITNVMTFKGNTSTAPALTNCSLGDVYIVTQDITVNTTETAKKGDMIIAYGTENSTTGKLNASGAKWIIVDGEEENTTYTIGSDATTIKLTADGGDDSSITLEGDSAITVSGDDDTLSIKHETQTAQNITNNGAAQLTNGGKFTAITGFTSNGFGHVTGVTTKEFTLPTISQTNDHKYAIDSTNKKITLQNSGGDAKGSTTYAVGRGANVPTAEAVKLEVAVSGTAPNGTVTYSHAKTARQDTNNTTAINLPDGQEFTVVTGVTSDTTGHITKITTQKYTAQDTKYTLSGAVVSGTGNSVTITDTLTGTDGAAGGSSAFTITSSNPTNLTVNGTGNEVSLGLVWGTF